MAINPQFIGTPRYAQVNVASANTAIDGTGAITSLITGASTGTRILEIAAQCSASSVAGLVNVFVSTDTGSTWRLFDQITISAAASSTTVKANRNTATYTNLVLPSASTVIGVTTTISQSTNVSVMGGDL